MVLIIVVSFLVSTSSQSIPFFNHPAVSHLSAIVTTDLVYFQEQGYVGAISMGKSSLL